MNENTLGKASGKARWRRLLRSRAAAVAHPDEEARLLRDKLADFLTRHPGATIASFACLPGEPELLPLIDRLPDCRWCLPRIVDDSMGFHHVHHVRELVRGSFDIREPAAGAPLVEPATIDIVLCPGLGFDRRGTRLGRGRGFYDRILARTPPSALRIGIAFEEQIADPLPSDPHDIPMTHLATPGGVVAIAP